MISYIQGKILERNNSSLLILAGGIGYEVLIPPAILSALPQAVEGKEQSLIIYYYLQVDQSRATPVMIGFRNSLERDFFEQFIQVASIGPRTAVRAIAQPIQKIAAAIESGDTRFLTGLPQIGQQKAREIVAKLQGKMGTYCLLDGGEAVTLPAAGAAPSRDLEDEVLSILLQLQYTRTDAQQMIRRALTASPPPQSTEEMLEIIYKQGRG